MRLRRVRLARGQGRSVAVWHAERWVPLVPALERHRAEGGEPLAALERGSTDLVAFLAAGDEAREEAARLLETLAGEEWSATFAPEPVLPLDPRSFRDFSLWERHMVAAARGIARLRFPPVANRLLDLYERVMGKPFPKLRPGDLWYEQPIYYLGNHLTFHPDGGTIPWPGYSRRLDYELELGMVIAATVRDVTPEEGLRAVGGFTVVNDLSARDVQYREMTEGRFGPVKSKGFASAMATEVVTADEVLPHVDNLAAQVRVNGQVWGRGTTAGMQHSLGDMVAYASLGEPLQPGELLATGTVPGCSGVEVDRWVKPDDVVELTLERVGSVRSVIGRP